MPAHGLATGGTAIAAGRSALAIRVAALATYVAFLAYQSMANGGAWSCTEPPWSLTARISRTDLLANVVAYVPLGVLGVLAAAARTTRRRRIAWYGVLVLAAIAGFSASMEWLQSCQPNRVSSFFDVAGNTGGGLVGVVLGLAIETLALRRARGASEVLVVPTAAARAQRRLQLLTLLVGVVWIASQTLPWTFSADVGSIRANLSFLRRWSGIGALDLWRLGGHAAAWSAIASAAHLLTVRPARTLAALISVSGASLVLQLLSATRAPLSFEELAGMAIAVVVTSPLFVVDDVSARRSSGALVMWIAALLAVAAYQLRPEAVRLADAAFVWWPRVGVGGMRGALDYAMLFAWYGLATVVAAAWTGRPRRLLSWSICAVVVMLALELAQTHIAGRSGDLSAPTFTLLGVLATRACLGERGQRSDDGVD